MKTHECEPRVHDPGYNEEGSKKRHERTYIIDAKEEEERKKNRFSLPEHNRNIAQYRVAGLVQKQGGDLTLQNTARTN